MKPARLVALTEPKHSPLQIYALKGQILRFLVVVIDATTMGTMHSLQYLHLIG